MSLPADADPDNTLGQLFTQSVELHCAAVPGSLTKAFYFYD
ncbi:hypothetical protein OK016_17250 [Vibrio chagasii]|nr:hypothetical protein [Vibrio chagasii]